MEPLYNAIVSFGHSRKVMKNKTGTANCASFDNYTNQGMPADGPPIVDLLQFTAWLDREKPGWKFMNIYRHADGAYLRSFTINDRPDAARAEDCKKGHVYIPWTKKYCANNNTWRTKQQRSGILSPAAKEAREKMQEVEYE